MAAIKRTILNSSDSHWQYQALQCSISERTAADACHLVSHTLISHIGWDRNNTLISLFVTGDHDLTIICDLVKDTIRLKVVVIEPDNMLEQFPTLSVSIGINGVYGYIQCSVLVNTFIKNAIFIFRLFTTIQYRRSLSKALNCSNFWTPLKGAVFNDRDGVTDCYTCQASTVLKGPTAYFCYRVGYGNTC